MIYLSNNNKDLDKIPDKYESGVKETVDEMLKKIFDYQQDKNKRRKSDNNNFVSEENPENK